MIVQGILTQNLYPYLHDAIYGAADGHPIIKHHLEEPPGFIREMIAVSERNPVIWRRAVRVASIFQQHKNALMHMQKVYSAEDDSDEEVDLAQYWDWDSMPENFDKELRLLDRMQSCLPYGVTREPRNNFECGVYSMCPWCRCRKAKQIMEKLASCLDDAQQLAYMKLVVPDAFVTDFEAHEKGYEALIKSLCKKRKLFFADHVVTVPNWRQTNGEEYSEPREFSLFYETTIIGLSHEPTELPLPEDIRSTAVREGAVFGGEGSGCWTVGPPTLKMLGRAMRTAMGFAPALLQPNLNPREFKRAMTLQDDFSAVGHGAARS